MPPPDPTLIERVAGEFGVNEGLIEKDWHVVQAIAALAAADHGGMRPVFSGGTSLSKGWGVIKRFSEDIDFKVDQPAVPSKGVAEKSRSEYRKMILKRLEGTGLKLGKVEVASASQFFSADLEYQPAFRVPTGFRPHLLLQMKFTPPARPSTVRPIQSLIGQYGQKSPETNFPCIALVETAADKMSALSWRVIDRNRDDPNDDPTIVRHLHDLAAIENRIDVNDFADLAADTIARDVASRAKRGKPTSLGDRLDLMIQRLKTDQGWKKDYDGFVRPYSYAPEADQISFEVAVGACERFAARIKNRKSG